MLTKIGFARQLAAVVGRFKARSITAPSVKEAARRLWEVQVRSRGLRR